MLRFPLLSALLLFPGVIILTGTVQAEEPLDFTRDIRPILSNKCFHCHGPDEAERYGGLRLDTSQGATGAADSGLVAIQPGDVEASELYRRITSTDESERMPPAESGPALEPAQIEKIKRWIEQGAEYAGHWSYQQPVRPALPEVTRKEWPKNAIDHFLLARLEKEGLQPRQEASREILIRRLSLDLTGLPPTPQEVDAFVQDESPGAYEKVVDRLLGSSAYGEHWARMWLDLSRYADSAGYADDPARTIWAFRDYVIRSLNDNKPFDQFTIEQLAGDLLPEPTDEQLIATAFHRNTMTNSEGGTDDEEFRNAAVVDRVNTTFAVWMGTTMACAQCHTHKFDPITQVEYFQLFAIFNNTADADRRDESPRLDYYTAEQKQQKQTWERELQELKQILATPTPELVADYQDWLKRMQPPLAVTGVPVKEVRAGSEARFAVDEEQVVSVENTAARESYELSLLGGEETSQQWTGLQLETFPESAAGGKNFVVTRVTAEIQPVEQAVPAVRYVRIELPGKEKMVSLAEVQVFSAGNNVALQGQASQSSTGYNGPAELAIDGNTDGDYFQAKSTTHTAVSENPWWELDLGAAVPVEQIVVWNRTDGNTHVRLQNFRMLAFDASRQIVWEENVAEAPQPSRRFELSSGRAVEFRQAYADYEQQGFSAAGVLDDKEPNKRGWAIAGRLEQAHQLTLVAAKPFTIGADEQLVVTIEQQSEHAEHVLRRFRVRLVSDPRAQELAGYASEIREALALKPGERAGGEEKLRSYYLTDVAPRLKKERQRVAQLEKSLANFKPYTSVPVMQGLPADQQRKTHVQIRGNFLSLGEEVQPGLPTAFHEWKEHKALPTRLDLARWLVDERNPLTARVIANRYWEKIFGIGLVATSEEFGSQGELPTHPELLDWLALELIENGWDLKAFLRELVMTAAYRQDSAVTQKLLEVDPVNRLISRGPRFRLKAEMVRDQALFVSGLLSRKMYGPPVNPPQPQLGLNAAFGAKIDWKTSSGEDKFRRGLYTTWRRSNPYPSMAAFDAPNRETCLVRRDRTNTPLQAFVTLNDPVYIEAAQSLARRMQAYAGNEKEKIRYGVRLCLARWPSEQEERRLLELYESARKCYEQQPEEAMKLATDPIGPLPEGVTAVEMAAWTMVGNVLLNLDEMLMKP